jgi:hypothetical protein
MPDSFFMAVYGRGLIILFSNQGRNLCREAIEISLKQPTANPRMQSAFTSARFEATRRLKAIAGQHKNRVRVPLTCSSLLDNTPAQARNLQPHNHPRTP